MWWALGTGRRYGLPHSLCYECVGVAPRGARGVWGASDDPWLDDGWVTFATGLDVTGIVRQSCAGLAIPTLAELRAGVPPLGQPGITPDAYGRWLGYSTSMAAYLHDRYGAAAYWSLTAAYLQNASGATNFPKVLQVTPDEFYAAWLVWLKRKYC